MYEYNSINQAYIDYCVSLGYPQEEFKIIDFWNIKSGSYTISSYGRIFSINKKLNNEMSQAYCNGYRNISLMSNNTVRMGFPIHRLVAMAFIPKTEEDIILERDFVNHKDLVKFNNVVWNLEWITNGDNIRHGRVNGAYERRSPISIEIESQWSSRMVGDNSGMSRLTEKQVHDICKCLEQRASYSDCCIYSGIANDDANRSLICNIARGVRRQDISSQYNIPKDNIRELRDYTRFVIPVCELLQQGHKIVDIVKFIKIDENYDRARMFVSGIKNRKTYTNISQLYNF